MKKFALLVVLAAGFVFSGCAHQPKTESLAFNEGIQTVERAPSAECLNGRNWDCKNARRNDPADQYMLDPSGNLYRYFSASRRQCQITNNVRDFKISQHPNDTAVIYYEREGDLYIVHSQGAGNDCPPVSKRSIMANVKEWKMVSNTNTTIVNAALSESGRFVAWDAVNPVYTQDGVIDFQMNQCFGVPGRSFSSYVLFTLNNRSDVNKVKVDGGIFRSDESKIDRGNWRSITEWKNEKNVCN